MSKLPTKKIFVSAGEVSGDAILGSVLGLIKSHYPFIELAGLGGSCAKATGLIPLFPIAQTAVSGSWDVLSRAFFMLKMLRKARATLESFKPDLVILVDYPGLNLRLASRARQLGIPVCFLAPPQTWAYRRSIGRNRRVSRALEGCSVHVLFPFEASHFLGSAHSLTTGHFFVTSTSRVTRPANSVRRICLCPGSRLPVLHRNLPLWLERLYGVDFFENLRSDSACMLGVLVPDHLKAEATLCVQRFRQGRFTKSIRIWTDKEAALEAHDLALAFPGTMTLELALHQIPTLVLAVLDPLTLAIGKRILKSKHLALPNLLLGDEIFPEWAGTGINLTQEIFAALWRELQAWDQNWGGIQTRLEARIGEGRGPEKVAFECLRLMALMNITFSATKTTIS